MLNAGQRIGSYVVVRHLADGGTSEVYLVSQEERSFALKILKESLAYVPVLQARLINEAVFLESLDIEGVVRVFGNGDFHERPYYVMEYLPTSLADQLSGPLSPIEILPRMATLARILAELHARGCVHRDVKPQNLLFTDDGQLRLADFGHAKLPHEEHSLIPHSTESGAFLGTRGYAAPEQLLNAKLVDGRADVYALGLVLFEALAGHPPFSGASSEDLARHRLTKRAPRLSASSLAISQELVTLVAQMLECSPQNRPTAREVAEQLERLPRNYFPAPSRRRYAVALVLPLFLSFPMKQVGLADFDAAPDAKTRDEAIAVLPKPESLSFPTQQAGLADFDKVLDEKTLDEAIALLSKADSASPGTFEQAKRTQKLADLARELGQLDQSKDLYLAAYQQFDLLQKLTSQANCATRLADMYLHLGELSHAGTFYDGARDLRDSRRVRQDNPDEAVYFFALYHLGLFFIEQEHWAQARQKLLAAREATTKPLWLARTEERLASLPYAQDREAHAQSALGQAEAALHQNPKSHRTRLVLIRTEFRLGRVRQNMPLQRQALDELWSMWTQDKRRALWGHELMELLMESLKHGFQDVFLRTKAREVLEEMKRQDQWRSDVHVNAWRKQLGI